MYGDDQPRHFRIKTVMKLRLLLLGVLALGVSLLGIVKTSEAATLSNRQDHVSRAAASAAADHEIRFTVTTAHLTPGQTIQVVFPALFDISTVIVSDLALTQGVTTGYENTTTLGASSAAGVWGVSFSGQTITLQVPTDAGVTGIPAGRLVVLRIGRNVVGGTHQITNPLVPALYRVQIVTTVDSGDLFVPIIASDALTVTATVPPTPSGGSNDSPGPIPAGECRVNCNPGPTILLKINGAQVVEVGATTARIVWTTNIAADSRVEYGQTRSYGGTQSLATLTTSHSISLTGLVVGHTYYVKITSLGSGQSVSDESISFFTAPPAQNPVIIASSLSGITDSAVTIDFSTNSPTYGSTTVSIAGSFDGIVSRQNDTTYGLTHSFSVYGLQPSTDYQVRMEAETSGRLQAEAVIRTFRTSADTSPPPTPTSFIVTPQTRLVEAVWNGGIAPNMGDNYVLIARTDRSPTTPTDGRTVYRGTGTSVTDRDLTPATRYYYALFSVDAVGNASPPLAVSTRTLEEDASPEDPPQELAISQSQIENIGVDHARIVWTTNVSASGMVEYGRSATYGTVLQNASLSTAHRFELTGLLANTDYFVRIRSARAGMPAVSEALTFRTLSLPAPPQITEARAITITERSASISVRTNVPTRVTIEARLVGGSVATIISAGDSTLQTTRTITLSGLQPGVSYELTVRAKDAFGQEAGPKVFTIQMLADTTPPPNASNFIATGLDRSVRLQWSGTVLASRGEYFVVVSRTDRTPTAPTDGREVYRSAGTSVVDTGLTPATMYYYALFAVDAMGNRSSGAIANARTLALSTPIEQPTPTTTIIITTSTEEIPIPTRTTSTIEQTTTTRDTIDEPLPTTTSTITEPPITQRTTTLSPIDDLLESSSTTPVRTSSSSRPIAEQAVQARSHFFEADGTLELLSQAGFRSTLPNQSLSVRIILSEQVSRPVRGQLMLGKTMYLLSSSQGRLETTVVSGGSPGDTTYEIVLEDAQGKRVRERGTIRVRALGVIREGALIARDQTALLEGAIVTIEQAGKKWPAEQWRQTNPTITEKNGLFGFLVPNSTYHIHIQREGYRSFDREIKVTDQVLAFPVSLVKELTPLAAILKKEGSLAEKIGALAENASGVAQITRDATQTPEAQAVTQTVVTPVAVVATVATTATAVSTFSLLNYLRFLFTQPLLLINRRKRKKWGMIYNALSKQPIELAIVRLLQAKANVVVQTRITDAQGRFAFQVPPGEYRIQVAKPNFVYPSVFLKDAHEDGEWLDVYHGETITVREETALTPNIPIDPNVKEVPPAQIIWKERLRKLQTVVGTGGLVVSIVACVIAPSVLMGVFVLAQFGTYGLFRRLAIPKKPTDWGIAYDDKTKKPLEKTIIRIFDKKFNKLLETQITNQKGKYGFFAAKGLYYVTAEKPGYDKYVSPELDLRNVKEGLVDQHIGLVNKGA